MNSIRQFGLKKLLFVFLTILIGVVAHTPRALAQPVIDRPVRPRLQKFGVVLDDGLWLVKSGKASRIADGRIVRASWSHDGRFLAYLTAMPKSTGEPKASVFDTQTGRSEELLSGQSLKWAPDKDILALQHRTILNLYDFRRTSADLRLPQMLGIDSFAFSSRGDTLLLGSNGDLRPDGWTHATLYTSQLRDPLSPTRPQPFFVIPREISLANLPGIMNSQGRISPIAAIHVSDMQYNQDDSWIGFVASPTAGIAVDHNALCVLRSNGRVWRPVGNIAGNYFDDWRFSPSGRQVGFIAGDERWPYRHKQTVTTTLADGRSVVWTPVGSADDSFAWASIYIDCVQSEGTALPTWTIYRPTSESL